MERLLEQLGESDNMDIDNGKISNSEHEKVLHKSDDQSMHRYFCLFSELDPEVVKRTEEQIFTKIKFYKDVSNGLFVLDNLRNN